MTSYGLKAEINMAQNLSQVKGEREVQNLKKEL
jgi:hypothetical protein